MEKIRTRVFSQVDILFIGLFYISFLHSALGALFYVSLIFYWRYGIKGCVKALLLVTTRGIINPAVASVPALSSFRWVIILGSSLLILYWAKIEYKDAVKLNGIIMAAIAFSITVAFSSFMNSSYPVTSIFKVISFVLPFIAIPKGIACTKQYCRWNDYFTLFYLSLFIISIVLIPFSRFRITNNDFQGVFNQVNMFGIVAALFVAAVLESEYLKEKSGLRIIIIVTVLVMIYLSASRTGMITAITTIVTYFLFSKKKISNNGLFFIIVFVTMGMVFFFLQGDTLTIVRQSVEDFLYKGGSNDLLASRKVQLALYRSKYEVNKFWGTGFMVPYVPGIVDYSLNFNLAIEPGNIIWTLLGDNGIVGTALFIIMIFSIVWNGKLSRIYLLVSAFMINMGEMVFFSSNNISILLYFLIAIYLFGDDS